MNKKIKRLTARNVHGHLNLHCEFNAGINIFYGVNASGKTTMLEILANALNSDFEAFTYLLFDRIEIQFTDESKLVISRIAEDDYQGIEKIISISIEEDLLTIPKKETIQINNYVQRLIPKFSLEKTNCVYFPAYRAVLENWTRDSNFEQTNTYSPYWLAPYTPIISFEPLIHIQDKVLSNKINTKVITEYLTSLNSFLTGKKINPRTTSNKERYIEVIFDDGYKTKGLLPLTSGERNIVSFLYPLYFNHDLHYYLIDEPELSLHVDWQRRLITTLMNINSNVQIIVCTHSPIIGADYPIQTISTEK